MPSFYVNAQPWNQSGGFGISDDYFGAFQPNDYNDVFNFGMGSNIFQGGMNAVQPTGGPVMMTPFTVVGNRFAPEFPINFGFEDTIQINPFAGMTGLAASNAEVGGVVTLPTFVVSENYFTSPTVEISTPDLNQGGGLIPGVQTTATSEGPVMLPTFTVSEPYYTTPSITFSLPVTSALTITTEERVFVTGVSLPPTSAAITTPPITTAPVTTVAPTSIPIFGGGIPTETTPQAADRNLRRNFDAELGETLTSLAKYQPQLLGMYKDLYQSFMPKGLTAAETSGLAQMQADEAKLNRLRQGILSPEDIRTATQGAREAYGARGQVFAPGAIGAEILNREAVRQQREDQARAAYQQSMGNLLNVSNLQTGNIFQPIGNLLSGTFNPLGAYPADVYGTNVNAALARDIADRNKEAAIESARMAGAAGSSAAKTSAAGSIGAAALPFLAKGAGALFGFPMPSCMPGTQCIDTPNGPKPVKDLKGGDAVIGYNGEEAFIVQACSWNQDPTRTFLTITREDGSAFTVCDDHKILGIPAMEWAEGADMAGSRIKSITASSGLLTSYDIMTNQGGYQIAGVPVNSMIPEIIRLAARFEALSAVQNPA